MRQLNLLVKLGFAALVVGSLGTANAATANGTATATVYKPIAVIETTPLAFGMFTISSLTPGTVVIDTSGTATPTGGVLLLPSSRSAALFTITGEPSKAITVSYDTTGAQLGDGSGNTMTLGTFTNTVLPTILDGGGTATFNVGATLSVNANQTSGIYSTGTGGTPYTVTVNYN